MPDIHPRASLLGLPRELRDQIWDDVFFVETANTAHVHLGRNRNYPPSLLRVSRQVRHESTEFFYANFMKCHPVLPFSEAQDGIEAFLPGIDKGRKIRIDVQHEWHDEQYGALLKKQAWKRWMGAEDKVEWVYVEY